LWARVLVRSYCRGELTPRRIERTLPAVRRAWRQTVGGKALPWYAEEKLRDGAFAALAGLALTATEDRLRWNALAIGDSCMFHVRGEELLAAFPLAAASSFGSRPHLLSSNPGQSTDLDGCVLRASGTAASGD